MKDPLTLARKVNQKPMTTLETQEIHDFLEDMGHCISPRNLKVEQNKGKVPLKSWFDEDIF